MSTPDSTQKVITRFPPSPTGLLHVGSVRTALYNYIFAKQHAGQFVLRIENTDKERSTVEFEKDMIDGLAWLGLNHDNQKIVRQSDQGEVYRTYLQKLVDEDKAYISKETPTEPGGRTEVIRFRNPNKKVTFTDLIRGDISFDTTELQDFVIAKSLTEPLYHLAVVIDDFEAGVTHIIRGEDGISNTPRQILIQEAIGAPRPLYAHLPLILAEDRSKLSKRKHGEKVSLKYYREKGFIPEAIINYVAMLGWNPGDDREMLSMDDLIKDFKLEKVQKGGAIFNEEKLKWLNKEYLKKMPAAQLLPLVQAKLPQIAPEMVARGLHAIIDRISVLSEIDDFAAAGEFSYFTAADAYTADKLLWKGKAAPADAKAHLTVASEKIAALSEFPTAEEVKASLWDYASEKGKGDVLWPLRYSLTGKDKSPDPFVVVSIIGKTESLKRIATAIALVS